MKKLLLLLTLLMIASVAKAQTTNITLQVTDAGSQTWNNGTWSVTLVSQPGANPFGPPFYQQGTSTLVPNQTQSGSLGSSGSASITLSQNAFISPAQSRWNFKVCSQATATNNCYVQFVTITATTSVLLTPPTLTINAGPGAVGYADTEVTGSLGQTYYNSTSAILKVCGSSTCTAGSGWSSAGSSSGGIQSSTYVTRVGGQVLDASFSNTMSVISFPDGDCTTAAQIGDLAFGTTIPTTFAGNGSVVVPQGTITATCGGSSTGTITVSTTASANCTASSLTACVFFFGPDESTALTNFWNAVTTSSCQSGFVQPGVYLVQSGQFNTVTANPKQCTDTASTSYLGPSLFGVGGPVGVVIVPTPNFSTTVGTGNSCGGGVDLRGCFFSAAGIFVQGFTIWGGGQNRSTDTNAFSIVDLNGGSIQSNAYARDIVLTGWASQAKNSYGVETNSASGVYLYNFTVNSAGGIACVGNEPFNGYTSINNGTCGNGLGLTQNSGVTNLGCLENLGSGVWFSNQVIYGTVVAPGGTSAWCIASTGGGAIFSHQDQIEGVSSSSGPAYPVIVTGGKIYMDDDTLTDSGGASTATDGIFETGGSAYIHNTSLIIGTVTGDKAIDNHLGGTLFDQGGNVFTTNAGIGNVTWGGIGGVNIVPLSCTGTATSSTTLFLQPAISLAAQPSCNNATASIFWTAPASGSIQGMFLNATHVGVNSSSGLVTLIKNGSNTAATCTFGTTTRCSYDAPASPIAFSEGDVFTISYTTQATEVLAGLSLQLWVQAQ